MVFNYRTGEHQSFQPMTSFQKVKFPFLQSKTFGGVGTAIKKFYRTASRTKYFYIWIILCADRNALSNKVLMVVLNDQYGSESFKILWRQYAMNKNGSGGSTYKTKEVVAVVHTIQKKQWRQYTVLNMQIIVLVKESCLLKCE